jgi:uncharacterized protein
MARATRYLFAFLGLVSVGLGILGAFLPGLPTTIFLILASWCFTRSCPWLEERLFRLRVLQPYVRIVRGDEPLSPRARIVSAVLMWTAITTSLAVLRASGGLEPWLAAVLMGSGLVGSVAIARFRRVAVPVRA